MEHYFIPKGADYYINISSFFLNGCQDYILNLMIIITVMFVYVQAKGQGESDDVKS
jgi:hypothetical protein